MFSATNRAFGLQSAARAKIHQRNTYLSLSPYIYIYIYTESFAFD